MALALGVGRGRVSVRICEHNHGRLPPPALDVFALTPCSVPQPPMKVEWRPAGTGGKETAGRLGAAAHLPRQLSAARVAMHVPHACFSKT
jgi:hypothetical protein